jgi:hypothetical protein
MPVGADLHQSQMHVSTALNSTLSACNTMEDYRLAGDVVLAATRVSAGVAAILASTSSTGFLVQACVT